MKPFRTPILVLSAIALIVPAMARAEDPVVFNDPGLEAAVRDALSIPSGNPIVPADMLTLTMFEASERGIVDLTGLEYATNLWSLNLSWNQIVDIGPLSFLTNLTWLDLKSNQISNITPLAPLTELGELRLQHNRINDLSALAELTALTTLDLGDNQVSNIGPLTELTNLTFLAIVGGQVSDIRPLSGLTQLTTLYLTGNQISNISPLWGMTLLTDLKLNQNQISNISALSFLANLTELNIARNQISDITPLSGLPNLVYADMGLNRITDVSPLADSTSLTELFLGGNPIDDISALSGLVNLRVLRLEGGPHGTWISDINPLSGLVNLQDLRLPGNRIVDIGPLSELANVETLDLAHNPISDVSPLAELMALRQLYLTGDPLNEDAYSIYLPMIQDNNPGIDLRYDPWSPPVYFADANLKQAVKDALGMTTDPTEVQVAALPQLLANGRGIADLTGIEYAVNLTDLRLSNNQIQDVSALTGLTKLTRLDMENNRIGSVAPLEGLTKLTRLTLWNNQISSISALLGMTNLTLLTLDNNQINDVGPLTGMTKLTDLRASGNQIQDVGPLAGLTALTRLDIENNQIESVTPLAGLTNLTRLTLGTNQIRDISGLSGLTNLTLLTLYINQIEDISALAGLTALNRLELQINQVHDISPLTGMTALQTLKVWSCPLSWESYCLWLPAIQANNPGLTVLRVDPNPYNCQPEPTPEGSGVAVNPTDTATGTTPVAMTFEQVTAAGATILMTSGTGPTPPAGFQLGDPATYYEITTSASYTGLIDVCISYAGVSFSGPPETLRLMHYEDGQWVDCTTGVDTQNQTVCGVVTSLSPFAIMMSPTPVQSISAAFNGTAIPAGRTIWFNSVITPKGLPSTAVTFHFTNSKIQSADGSISVQVPDAILTFDPAATCAQTHFIDGQWVTRAPASGLSGNIWLSGVGLASPGLPGGIKDVTWSGNFICDTPGVTLQWKWAAAVYTCFPGGLEGLGVKSVDGNRDCSYSNSDHAGTPEAIKSCVTGGARGGGGSNYTGGYSGTLAVTPYTGN